MSHMYFKKLLFSKNLFTTHRYKERINYPEVEQKAVDEYDTSIDILALGFPWLFPGGYGGPFGPQPTSLTL